MSKIPTIRKIAEACGYHNTTVSRALSNKPNIPEKTRKRILEVANELGWRPNPMASAYLAHRYATREPSFRATIAWINPYRVESDASLFHLFGYEGAKERASTLGYSLEKIWLGDAGFNGKRLTQMLKARGIPGMIFENRGEAVSTLKNFDWDSFSIATWSVRFSEPPLHHASYHHAQGISTILHKLLEIGYTRIAMMLSEETNKWAENSFYQTFFYMEKHSPPKVWMRSYKFNAALSDGSERKRIKAWILRNKPEVILGQVNVWEALQEMGWRIPEDVAFVSPYCSEAWPDIGGVNQQPEVIASNAVDLVATQLLHNERGIPKIPKLLLNEGEWFDAKSVPHLIQREKQPAHSKKRKLAH